MDNYRNKYSNNMRSANTRKRAFNSYDNKSIKNGGNKTNRSFAYGREKSKNREKYGNLDDYKKLAKKYYNIIMGLQEELTKQTINNYNLREENIELKQKINDIMQNQ